MIYCTPIFVRLDNEHKASSTLENCPTTELHLSTIFPLQQKLCEHVSPCVWREESF